MSNSILRLISLYFLLALFPTQSFARVDLFYSRYEKASDIVYGEIVSIEDAKKQPKEFQEFDISDTKKAKIKIIKSWKGQKNGEIEFYFNLKHTAESDLEKSKKHIYPIVLKYKYLLFLRDIGGLKCAETYFGAKLINEESSRAISKDYAALDLLAAGKSMDEAVKVFGLTEVKAYKDFLSKE